MWRNFDENVVDKDFALLKEHGVNTIRIFPLWSDFQPVSHTFSLDKSFCARTDDKPLGTRAGLDETMLSRFSSVLDLADKYGFKVVVGLITGWMSGRLFYPEILYNENPLTSPKAILWETRFIKEFVSRFKDRDCIIAWEPGNECNCLDVALPYDATPVTAEQAELWLSSITDAIRVADNTRPVWSGMHGLGIDNSWDIRTNGEYVDMQTTHPYPLFTPYCAIESLTTMRAALHAAAESAYYADLAKHPCLVEEIGILGPNVLSDDYSAEYLEQSLFTSFQYGTTGYLWWCAFDQDAFEFPPYDGSTIERNLGLAKFDGTAKPILKAMKKMSGIVAGLGNIPAYKRHATVILTDGRNSWKSAYGAFCLAAQAGYGVEFMYRSQPLKDSDVYIIPSISADVYLKFLPKLTERVKNGAKLLISFDGGHIPNIEELMGVRVLGRECPKKQKNFVLNGKSISIFCNSNILLNTAGAEVILEEDGNVLLSENKIGKGSVIFFNAPLENYYSESYKPYEKSLHEIYRYVFKDVKRPFAAQSDYCCTTVHEIDEKNSIVLIYNFGKEKNLGYTLADGYEITGCDYATAKDGKIIFSENFACVRIAKAEK